MEGAEEEDDEDVDDPSDDEGGEKAEGKIETSHLEFICLPKLLLFGYKTPSECLGPVKPY